MSDGKLAAESEEFKILFLNKKAPKKVMNGRFEGIITFMKKKSADNIQKGISNKKIGACFKLQECSDCKGTRLRKESREVTLNNISIVELSNYTIKELLGWTDIIHENLFEDSLIISKPKISMPARGYRARHAFGYPCRGCRP